MRFQFLRFALKRSENKVNFSFPHEKKGWNRSINRTSLYVTRLPPQNFIFSQSLNASTPLSVNWTCCNVCLHMFHTFGFLSSLPEWRPSIYCTRYLSLKVGMKNDVFTILSIYSAMESIWEDAACPVLREMLGLVKCFVLVSWHSFKSLSSHPIAVYALSRQARVCSVQCLPADSFLTSFYLIYIREYCVKVTRSASFCQTEREYHSLGAVYIVFQVKIYVDGSSSNTCRWISFIRESWGLSTDMTFCRRTFCPC